ncbi:sphingosine-1-phosphate lyase [Suhomyces tanzawaensis NRRL Y-17324]|uniref:sphinganine-1-phosphate aldolase n=1 Tax=Suhomyces tanzawaensis NRRL Y-17324 TaxID=984487 RepID=A0A1E4SID5_9ASCO|nr:sphingosine-1-phosphate lyase [Suhomyces tanzawaensis NRRL Y-17324]ODV79255.1 sphingosine-1-phosphate lyase [Suhomyces tanzawaensis NRRL Y-17324]
MVLQTSTLLQSLSQLRAYRAAQGPVSIALAVIRDAIVLSFVLNWLASASSFLRGYGIVGAYKKLNLSVKQRLFRLFLSLPPVKKKVDSELLATVVKMEAQLMQNSDELLQFPIIPNQGLRYAEISAQLDQLQQLKHTQWQNGRVSGAVYHGGDQLLELQSNAFHKYAVANQLHPDVFPGVRKMEAEVVSMVLDIFNGPVGSCGSTTSGGTESLLLTSLAAREYGKKTKGITKPEVIAPVTVHAGIEKACYYFGMKLHKVDLDPVTYQVDIRKVKRLINGNTVLLVGSAPNFPHGIIDDIEALSGLATKYKIPLHVDACLGSFIVSFLESSQVHGSKIIPKFDFRLPGVTSISCDTHKYGFAPKGSSVLLYRSPELRQCQYYVLSDWTGGMYGSPTLAGSRPGALMVGCWATLVNIGKDGYRQFCKEIVTTAMEVKRAIQEHPVLKMHLEIIGDPIASVISFKVTPISENVLNIYELGDVLNSKGWHFSSLQNPSALHFAFTKLSISVGDDMVKDLVDSVQQLLVKEPASGEEKKQSDTAALYGVAGSVKTVGIADKIIVAFLDTLYKVEPTKGPDSN